MWISYKKISLKNKVGWKEFPEACIYGQNVVDINILLDKNKIQYFPLKILKNGEWL